MRNCCALSSQLIESNRQRGDFVARFAGLASRNGNILAKLLEGSRSEMHLCMKSSGVATVNNQLLLKYRFFIIQEPRRAIDSLKRLNSNRRRTTAESPQDDEWLRRERCRKTCVTCRLTLFFFPSSKISRIAGSAMQF
jgi:hypothetical protein